MVYKYLNWVSIDQNEIQYYVPMSPNHVDIVGKTQPNINLLAEFDVHTHPPPLIGTQYQQYFSCYSTYLDQKFRGNTIFNKVTTVPVTFVHLFWTTKLIGQNFFWSQYVFGRKIYSELKLFSVLNCLGIAKNDVILFWNKNLLDPQYFCPYIFLDLKYLLGLTHLKYT